MKTASLFFGLLLINLFSKAQNYSVQLINTGIPNSFNSLFFVNEHIGFAIWQDMSSGGYVKTTDGGATWFNKIVSANPSREIFMINKDTGCIASFDGILKTINGGNNWTNVKQGMFGSVYFTSYDTGYASGAFGNGLYKTTDGGNTWLNAYSGSMGLLYFQNSQIGYGGAGGFPYNVFFKTTDAGNTWATVSIPGLNNGAMTFYFADTMIGYVGEWEKGIYKTIDGGITWTSLNLGPTFYLRGMHFLNAQRGFAVGTDYLDGAILETFDGGNTWTTLYSNQGVGQFTDVYFPTPCTGYASGLGGVVARLDCVTDINENTFIEGFTIYPNPSNGSITLKIPHTATGIEVMNSLGQVVEKGTVTGETSANFTLKEKGFYFVSVITNDRITTKKCVVN